MSLRYSNHSAPCDGWRFPQPIIWLSGVFAHCNAGRSMFGDDSNCPGPLRRPAGQAACTIGKGAYVNIVRKGGQGLGAWTTMVRRLLCRRSAYPLLLDHLFQANASVPVVSKVDKRRSSNRLSLLQLAWRHRSSQGTQQRKGAVCVLEVRPCDE